MFAHVSAGDGSRFGEERIVFRSSLDPSGLDATGSISHSLLCDEDEEVGNFLSTRSADLTVAPSDPELQGMFETELSR